MVPITPARDLLATLELAGATALAYAPGFFNRYYTHLELLTGAKYVTDSGTFIGIAGGVGLSPGVGTPDARAIIMVGRGYADPVPNGAGPGDSDGDGVSNSDDQCVGTRMGAHPDPDRPGCPSQDYDRDGYINQLDNCPAESAGAHPDLERVGCPLRDTDGDSVFDRRDECPSEPRGENPDGAHPGCPARAHDESATSDGANGDGPIVVRNQQIVLREQLYFAANRDRIMPRSFPALQEIVQIMAARPDIRLIRIEGHSDGRGSFAHNMRLSAQRAASVREWLIAQGIEADRLLAEGLGSTRPVVDDLTAEGRARNRRVEFHIVNGPVHDDSPGSPQMRAGIDAPNRSGTRAVADSTALFPDASPGSSGSARPSNETVRGVP
jgi:outer membrane protein OmpA-like peptidoglycan-associated protein